MYYFDSAAEVKRHLKEKGLTDKVSVRSSTNPFSGNLTYGVHVPVPEGVAIIESFGSREPLRFFSDDGSKTAGLLQQYADALKGTNGHVRIGSRIKE